jgi:putative DNA primase/helicase
VNLDARADNNGDGEVSEFDPLPNGRALTLATAYLKFAGYAPESGPLTLRRWREDFYKFTGYTYQKMVREELFTDVVRFLNAQTVWKMDKEGGWHKERLNVTTKLANEVLMQMGVATQASVERMPEWLDRHRPARENVIAFRNGWIDIAEYLQGRQAVQNPPTPHWFSETAIPYDFSADAQCPLWREKVDEILSGDAESIKLLQQWFGLNLVPDLSYQKMMIFHGVPNSGKGTVSRVLKNLVGEANVAAPKLARLGKGFGLAGLLNKTVAILADAHLGDPKQAEAVLDAILGITGKDPVDVERKFKDDLSNVTLRVRFTMAVNMLPTFPDPSMAIRRRLLVLPFLRSFEKAADPGLDEKLLAETPGIMLWALDGLRSLKLEGRFAQPKSGDELIARMCRLSNPILGFVDECLQVHPDAFGTISSIYEQYKKWAAENGYGTKNVAHFGEAVREILRQRGVELSVKRLRDGDTRSNAYVGVGLRLEVP